MLQDYETLSEILKEHNIPQKHYSFVKRQLHFLKVPEASLPLELRSRKRQEQSKNKEEREGADEIHLSPNREYNRKDVRRNYLATVQQDNRSEMEALVCSATSDSEEEPKPLRF